MKTETQVKAPRTRSPSKAAGTASTNLARIEPAAPAPIVHQVHESAGMQLLRTAVARGASIDELDRLIALKERMEASDAKQAFTAAMVQFKRNPPKILTNKTGTVRPKDDSKQGFEYRYADLAAVCDKVIEALAAVQISHHWTTAQEGHFVHVTCTLTHELGHSISTTLMASPDDSGGKNRIQAIGSAVTYLRRYTLLAITGVAVESEGDDDGAGGITAADRAELRAQADQLRQGRGQRPSPQQVAGRDSKAPPPEALLDEARKAADKGHKEFGPYWRNLTEDQRGQLMSEMANLTDRASAATAHLAVQDSGK